MPGRNQVCVGALLRGRAAQQLRSCLTCVLLQFHRCLFTCWCKFKQARSPSAAVLEWGECCEVREAESTNLLWRGLRVKVGLHWAAWW